MCFASLVAVVMSAGCCVTTTEHNQFVKSSRLFFSAVAPVYQADAEKGINDQSRQNRLGLLRDYEAALAAAETRAQQ